MAHCRKSFLLSSVPMAIGLSACGGGGGGISSIAPPPPPPTQICPDGSVIPATAVCPPLPPPSPNFVNIFPGITTTTDFAVLGLQANALGGAASSLVSNGFAVQYDAVADAYVIDLPSLGPGKFHATSESEIYWNGALEAGGANLDTFVHIFKPLPANPALALEHTTFGVFDDYDGFYDYDELTPAGFFAFGLATPAGSVPTTGSATFDAIVRGLTLDTGRPVGGDASLQFDFGAGTLAGNFNPYTFTAVGGQASLGPYSFVNTVFGIGSTTFAGQLQHSGISSFGAFNGLFTGPTAEELMARWTAPYVNPDTGQQSEMFGIWVGRRP
jgi:hypothetical protein